MPLEGSVRDWYAARSAPRRSVPEDTPSQSLEAGRDNRGEAERSMSRDKRHTLGGSMAGSVTGSMSSGTSSSGGSPGKPPKVASPLVRDFFNAMDDATKDACVAKSKVCAYWTLE